MNPMQPSRNHTCRCMKKFNLVYQALAGVICLVGCDRSADSGSKQAAQQSVAAIAGEQDPASDEGAPNTITAADPMSLFAEGRRYRAAIQAIDAGDINLAQTIRQEFKAPYETLATAIEAIILVKQGEASSAIALAEQISAVPAMRAEAYVIAGEAFHQQNDLTAAISAFASAIQENPQHARAYRWLGISYYDTGAMRLATTQLRSSARLDPQDVNSLLLSAKIFQDYEQYEEAISDYDTVLKRSDKAEVKLISKTKQAECLIALRKLDEASKILEGIPPTPAATLAQAAIAEARGELEQAQRMAESVLKSSPKQRTAILILGRVYNSQRRWEEAIRLLEGTVSTLPYDYEIRLLYGRALQGAGQKDKAEAEISQATEIKNTFLSFADLHQEAIKAPEDANLRVRLGEMAEKIGRRDLALMWYRAALGLEPSLGNVQAAIDRIQAEK
jgi:tetratricopeptide (TPR) repeat protein